MSKRKQIRFKATAGNGRFSEAAKDAARAADQLEPELTTPSDGYLNAPALVGLQEPWRKQRLLVWHEVCDNVRAAGFRATACYALAIETFAAAVVLNRLSGGAKGTQDIIKFCQLFCMSPSGRVRKLDEANPANEKKDEPLAPLGLGALQEELRRRQN